MARDHGNSIPPVRVLRILAGEGFGKFSSTDQHSHNSSCCGNIPLSVAMDYVGATLDESSTKMQRLQNNVEEYSRLCSEMEIEIDALLSSSLTREDKSEIMMLPSLFDLTFLNTSVFVILNQVTNKLFYQTLTSMKCILTFVSWQMIVRPSLLQQMHKVPIIREKHFGEKWSTPMTPWTLCVTFYQEVI